MRIKHSKGEYLLYSIGLSGTNWKCNLVDFFHMEGITDGIPTFHRPRKSYQPQLKSRNWRRSIRFHLAYSVKFVVKDRGTGNRKYSCNFQEFKDLAEHCSWRIWIWHLDAHYKALMQWSNVHQSTYLIQQWPAVHSKTFKILDSVQLPQMTGARVTATHYHGKDYAYLPRTSNIYRYEWNGKNLTLDKSWGPVPYLLPNQTTPSACGIMGDCVVCQTNAVFLRSHWVSLSFHKPTQARLQRLNLCT